MEPGQQYGLQPLVFYKLEQPTLGQLDDNH
jgi:hypothetical protein